MPSLTEAELLAFIAAIQAAINALAVGTVQRYRIGEREFERYELTELIKLLGYYQDLLVSIPAEETTVFDDDCV